MASAAARERYALRGEEAALRRAFAQLDTKNDKKIDAQELSAYFSARGHVPRHRHEAEDMVWEGDEDCDGALSWAEFAALHRRARDDSTDTEPRGLHDVVAFAMADSEGKGRVSLEAAMEMTYLRVGRAALDAELAALFGGGAGGEGGGGGGGGGEDGNGNGSSSSGDGFELDAGRTLSLTEWLDRLGAQQARRLAARPGVGSGTAAAAGNAAAGASDDGGGDEAAANAAASPSSAPAAK
jgi:Ca2+-binding EF-hand superfamily protein